MKKEDSVPREHVCGALLRGGCPGDSQGSRLRAELCSPSPWTDLYGGDVVGNPPKTSRLPGNRGCGADSPLSLGLGLEGGSGRTLHTSTAESLALSANPEWSCCKARTYCPLEHTASPGWPVSMRGGTDGWWRRGLLTAAAVWALASLSASAPLPPKAAVLSGENLYLGRCNEFEPAISMAI